MSEKPLEINLSYTKEKIVIARNTEKKEFSVKLPKYSSVGIHHREAGIDVMASIGGGRSTGKTLNIPEDVDITLIISVNQSKTKKEME